MNELIQKLAEESGLDARTMGVSHTEQWNASVSKLTQLIVEECANIFGQEGTGRYEVDGNWISKTIKQHFGVEE